MNTLRFYPSLASITTHFSNYRATALGIAAAGSSVGEQKGLSPVIVVPQSVQRVLQVV